MAVTPLLILARDLPGSPLYIIDQGIERMIELTSSARITLSATESSPEPGIGPGEESGLEPLQETGFGQLLSDQEGVLKLLEQLMPEEEIGQEETLPQGGTDLPAAADIVTDALAPMGQVLPIPPSGTAATGTPQIGTSATRGPQIETPAIGAPQTGTPAIEAPQIGTPAIRALQIGTPAIGIPKGGVIPVISLDTGRHFEVSASDESVASGFPGTVTVNPRSTDPTLIQSLMTEKSGTATAVQLPQIDPTLISDGEKPVHTDNRADAFATTLGRITGEGGITVRPVTAPLPSFSLPPGQDGWSQELGDRVLWMVGRSIQSASLRVTPPQMGSIEIQVTLQNDQAQVSFTTHHGAVKEALEAAIPRLREMFGENNLRLVSVDVGQRGEGDSRLTAEDFAGQGEAGDPGRSTFSAAAEPGDELPGSGTEHYYRSNGLLDDFA
jgi:hypothetical protein